MSPSSFDVRYVIEMSSSGRLPFATQSAGIERVNVTLQEYRKHFAIEYSSWSCDRLLMSYLATWMKQAAVDCETMINKLHVRYGWSEERQSMATAAAQGIRVSRSCIEICHGGADRS